MKILLFIFPFSVLYLYAADVKLGWDAPDTSGITNYVIYAHTNSLIATNLSLATMKTNTGTNLSVTVSVPSGSWFFAATATSTNGIETGPSNILFVDIPKPPERLRIIK